MRASILGGLLATALMVGCGAPVEQDEAADPATQEGQLVDCTWKPDSLDMYFNSTFSEQVGGRGCYCGNWENWGTRTAYIRHLDAC